MWTRGHTTVALGATAMTGTALYFSTYWSPTQIFAEDSVQPRTAAGIPPNSSYPPTMKIYDKELPVVTVFDDDTADLGKPRLVILGSGWGATSLLKDLQPNGYYTVVISPQNYFLFTPLLPEATTGTVEARSLLESIRKICRGPRAHFCEAQAYDVHLKEKVVEVVGEDGRHFLVPYDKLVIAVGAQNNTMGVPGVPENTSFLKSIADARHLRWKLMDNFEVAALPTTSESERKRFLSIVVAGGGPTGVEYAAELDDFLREDIAKYFPELCREAVSITIVQSGDHILNTFQEAISQYAEERFKRHDINVITNARVVSVEPGVLTYRKKKVAKGEQDTFEIPFGICVWSTGIGLRDFTRRLVDKLQQQENKRAIEVDSRLRVKGTDDVYAIGDCSTIENPQMMEIVKENFKRTGMDRLNYNQFQAVISMILDKYPQTRVHLRKLHDLFDKYDIDHDNYLDMGEIAKFIDEINKQLTNLPATAQVARQQGEYLAHKFNGQAYLPPDMRRAAEKAFKPFHYKHLGSFSYVGSGSAVIDLGDGRAGGGFGVFLLWRSAYLAKQVSFRTRALLAVDWCKSKIFGRDITRS